MKPIRIFTHCICEPAGYIHTLLQRLQYPHEQVCLFDGDQVPTDLDNVAALVFMGGPGDVNQPSDWMLQEMELIRKADASGIPVLGICLGGQLVSKALGGRVWEADGLEVGWHDVQLLPPAEFHPWFEGLPQRFQVFQWHAHSFAPPAGVQSLATSECTECQAYVHGQTMAIQFHLEMTESIITTLLGKYAEDLDATSDCVLNKEQILDDIKYKTEQTFAVADILLERWFHSVMSA